MAVVGGVDQESHVDVLDQMACCPVAQGESVTRTISMGFAVVSVMWDVCVFLFGVYASFPVVYEQT